MWERVNIWNSYQGNMNPPKQQSTCSGKPLRLANAAISSIGSNTPWQNWGAEATNITVFASIAYHIR